MSASTDSAPGPTHDRRTEVRRLIDAMEHAKVISDGHFSALGMLITDASLSADEPALVECQDGLQWLHRHYLDVGALDAPQREQRGRILGLIDVVHWALKRLPSGLQLALQPEGYAARFLVAVARRPGMSNRQLAAELGTDETEISRTGRKLLSAGVVWRRKEWRHNAWDLTPRGRRYLETSGLLPADADAVGEPVAEAGSGRRAEAARPAETVTRSPDGVPRRAPANGPSRPQEPPRSARG
ncbi:MarR family winged helix-turn-helix transcriptional regulator [Actinomadura sp. 7K534]|uniref:MarR family winged helix-turn-helix transcriptional regulator n=1 Tax=Actinomadura sp. 7K534 TaxID=2530366 RepID=UPI00104C5E66|nr:MarR family winged helix-turn-helix transcriptional regulator [Actinomadura sp. 7K534]TDB95087.1 MarR family transcriptional regulator [Actinomadura sp. 7K534]